MHIQGHTNPKCFVRWATECHKVAPKVFSIMTAFFPLHTRMCDPTHQAESAR